MEKLNSLLHLCFLTKSKTFKRILTSDEINQEKRHKIIIQKRNKIKN